MAFGKVGELYKLQKEARAMQKKMKQLTIRGESKDGDITVTINGVNELEELEIDDELLTPDRKRDLVKKMKQAFKAANKKLQKSMMKDVDMDKMKGMLGM
jgi:DNA-binding protein YbaB